MKIETKFSVGDKAFTIHNNQLWQVKIYAINTLTYENYQSVTYDVLVTDDIDGNVKLNQPISENDLYADEYLLFDDFHKNMNNYVDNPTADLS